MIHGSFYRFVCLFQLCLLAWKSSCLQNKICSTNQIFFRTFQFQVSKVNFWHHFGSFLSFSISSSPIFRNFKALNISLTTLNCPSLQVIWKGFFLFGCCMGIRYSKASFQIVARKTWRGTKHANHSLQRFKDFSYLACISN